MLIADNHPIFRAGLRKLVGDLEAYAVVGEASDGDACISQAAILKPDIVTLDLNMPGKSAFEVIVWIRQSLPASRLLIVSMHSDRAFVERVRELGAHGFVAKEDAGSELAMGFEGGGDGFFMSSSAGRAEPLAFPSEGPADDDAAGLAGLTFTELRVLECVATSRTSREIARELGVSPRTIHTHRTNICEKLGLRGANALLHYAVVHSQAIARLRAGAR